VKFREEKEGPLETKKKTTEVNDLKLEASCILPIQRKDKFLGKWELRTYSSGGIQHVALIKNPEETLKGKETKAPTLVRVHSECFTGNTLGSLRCDCDDQLDSALIKINEEGKKRETPYS
jgi:GTP cyclohydrolase II